MSGRSAKVTVHILISLVTKGIGILCSLMVVPMTIHYVNPTHGKAGADVSLREGDVVLVPVYGALVGATGFVKRPMFYEMKDGEPLSALVAYARMEKPCAEPEW